MEREPRPGPGAGRSDEHGLRYRDRFPFPDPERFATPEGLVAWGRDLRPERLLAAYESGIFPWYEQGPVLWFSPDPRWVLRPEDLRVSRSLRKTLRRGLFRVTADAAFDAVIHACAEAVRPDQEGTWIGPDMIEAYRALHRLGFAHSVEAWAGHELAGGLYGVSLGAAFFGESMFTSRSDASKVAFVHLVEQLAAWDFDFVDCQVHTAHLERFGAAPWPRGRFLGALGRALARPTRRGVWHLGNE